MAATILAKDVLWRVSQQLGDVSPQFIKWTERELVFAFNDGQKIIASLIPSACSRIDSVKLVTGAKQSISLIPAARILPGDGSVAADTYGQMLLDIICTMGTDGLTRGRAIRVASREVLDAFSPAWPSTSGTPVSEYTFDPRTPKDFYVCPAVPAATSTWVELAWLVNPNDIVYSDGSLLVGGGSTAKVSIDDQFVDLLVNYILARAHMRPQVGSPSAATAHTNMFVATLNAQAKALTGVNPNLKTLPMTPEIPAAAQ